MLIAAVCIFRTSNGAKQSCTINNCLQTFLAMHLGRLYIAFEVHVLSVLAFPENRTHDFAIAYVMLFELQEDKQVSPIIPITPDEQSQSKLMAELGQKSTYQ